MSDPTNESHLIDGTAQRTDEGFTIPVSSRVRNLPPYLFGKINDLKAKMRRAGKDVIDLGMGNPTDPPSQYVIDKLCEAAQDDRNHRYSVAAGVLNLRREVAKRYLTRFNVELDPNAEIVTTIGSKEGFSHMCLALLGPGRYGLRASTDLPDPRACDRGTGRCGTRSRRRISATRRSSCPTSP